MALTGALLMPTPWPADAGLLLVNLYLRSTPTANAEGHNYIGHNYLRSTPTANAEGHNYIGHNYLRSTPTANAEGLDRIGGVPVGEVSARRVLQAPSGRRRVLGVRRRRGPRY